MNKVGYNNACNDIYMAIKTHNQVVLKDIRIDIQGRDNKQEQMNNFLNTTGQSICANCHKYSYK